jgi:hypothetical protein
MTLGLLLQEFMIDVLRTMKDPVGQVIAIRFSNKKGALRTNYVGCISIII